MKLSYAAAILAAIVLTGPAFAQSPDRMAVRVADAWARPTPPTAKSAAAYLTIVTSGAEDRLVGASTPIAGEAEVHETVNENGVMKMRPAGTLTVKPGTPVALKPGGLHVMMTNLKEPLADGQTFPLTLVFAKAGAIQTVVHVQRTAPSGAAAAPAAEMPMNMDHSKMGH